MEAAVALTGDARGRAASQPGDGGENTPPERKVYMDYNATTPLEPEVIQVMTEAMREAWGNPSSPYPTVVKTAAPAQAITCAAQPVGRKERGGESDARVLQRHFWKLHVSLWLLIACQSHVPAGDVAVVGREGGGADSQQPEPRGHAPDAGVVSDAHREPGGASRVSGTELAFGVELPREGGPEDLPGRKAIWSLELEPRPSEGRVGGGSHPASCCWQWGGGTRSHPCVCVREGTVSHHSAVVKPENAAVSTAVFRCIRAVGVSGARVLSLGRAPLHVEAPLSPRLHLPDT
uniref:Selenocysteine lyase n=1 Tax=Felis catus TaxID=9685 RepID=A0ABI7X058_FELCA